MEASMWCLIKYMKAVYFGREEIQSFILSSFYFSSSAHLTNYMRTPYRSAYFYVDDCPGLKHHIKSFWFLTFNLFIQNPLQQKTNSQIILSTTLFLPVTPLTLVTKNQLLGFHPSPPQLWLPCSSLGRNKQDKSAMTLKARRRIFSPNRTWAFPVKSLFLICQMNTIFKCVCEWFKIT